MLYNISFKDIMHLMDSNEKRHVFCCLFLSGEIHAEHTYFKTNYYFLLTLTLTTPNPSNSNGW